MTTSGLFNPKEALEFLGLYDPKGTAKPNTDYLTRLARRELLIPIRLGTRKFRYKKTDCEKLLRLAETGVSLTSKPDKK